MFQNIFYNISSYNLTIKNMLVPYQINTQSEEVFYKNAGKAVNNGIELSLKWICHKFNLSSSYTFMNFKYKDFITTKLVNNNLENFQLSNNEVPGVPRQNFSIGFSYKFLFGLTADIFMNWTDKFYVNDFNGPEPNSLNQLSDYINNSYLTADFNINYSLAFGFMKAELFLGVNNLFDKRYNGSIIPNAAFNRYYEPAAGRNWNSGITIKFI